MIVLYCLFHDLGIVIGKSRKEIDVWVGSFLREFIEVILLVRIFGLGFCHPILAYLCRGILEFCYC